jgi:hypothetical protein
MAVLSLISIVTSFLVFGGIMAFTVLFVNKRFWSTFKGSSLLGLDPNRADLLFANGTAFAVKSFPWVVLLALVASVIFYLSGRHLLAALIAWLPLLTLLIPVLLFVIKVIGSR